MNSATTYLLPVLEKANLPRAAIWAPLPHSGLVNLAFDTLIERACKSVLQGGRRVAVLSPHAQVLESATRCLLGLGLPEANYTGMLVTPVGAESITRLLLERADRPDAIFVTDDNLIEPLLRGFEAAKIRPKRDVYVLGHCNWPHPIGIEEGVDHIGFDVREIFLAAKEVVEAQRDGDPSPKRTVEPRFASELFDSAFALD
jgi:DNA-binding LacI/PurR family transcriptional regulator